MRTRTVRSLAAVPPAAPAAKHYHQAVDLYSDALAITPSNAILLSNRAFAHIRLEEYGSAIQDATQALECDPKYAK